MYKALGGGWEIDEERLTPKSPDGYLVLVTLFHKLRRKRIIMEHILITGANRGLGFEFTRQYLEQGAQVFAGCRLAA